MGLLDGIEGMIAQRVGGGAPQMGSQTAQPGGIAGSLMQAFQEHPGGISGVLDSFRQNGMDQHVNNWSSGQSQTATPDQVQQGLGGTGLIERTAERAGISPEVAKIAIAAALPMVLQHFAHGGQGSL